MFVSRFHSFLLAIGFGGALAAMLLFNSVSNYVAISQRVAQDHRIGVRPPGAERMRARLVRNLAINCSSGVALLIALAFIARRFRGYVDAKRIEGELDMARQVQLALLPAGQQRIGNAAMSAECTPASEVGGDFYDAFDTADGRIACVLGDVCGKGLPAALLMGVVHGAVRSSEWHQSRRDHENASMRLNSLLCDRVSCNRFTTLFWGYQAPGSDQFHYINAGHCPPLLVRRRNRNAEAIPLEGGGPVLGLLRSAEYEQQTVRIGAGDVLVMYSDGLIEAANEMDQEWGEARLRHMLETSAAQTPGELRSEILAALREWTGQRPLADDCTLMVIQFAPAHAHLEQEFRAIAC